MSSTLTPPPTGPSPDPQQQYYGQAGPEPVAPRSRAATAGLFFGILFFPIGLVASIIGIKHTQPGGKRGRGLAIAGLIISGLATVFWVVVIAVAVAMHSSSSTTASAPAKTAASAPSATAIAQSSSAAPAKAATPAAPAATMGQTQALRSAKQYLSMQAFSYKGLIEQLSSSAGDGFSVADATYAADHCGADWNAEAAKSAKEYLSTESFSHAGLVEQLESSSGDGYTAAQAEYGVEQAGL